MNQETEYKNFSIEIQNDETAESPFIVWDSGFVLEAGGKFSHLGNVEREPESYVKKWTVYGYSHGGLTVSLSPFSCRVDSGVLGFLYQVDDGFIDAEKAVQSFIDSFNNWLSGEVYGYIVKYRGAEIESSWGYYDGYEYCLSQAKEIVDGINDTQMEEIEKNGKFSFLDNMVGQFKEAFSSGILTPEESFFMEDMINDMKEKIA